MAADVLVVDDEADIRELVAGILSDEGYAVRTATLTGPPEAVDAAIAAAGIPGDDVIAPVRLAEGVMRTIVRFDYRRGGEVAGAFRTEILRHATGRRPRGRGARVR